MNDRSLCSRCCSLRVSFTASGFPNSNSTYESPPLSDRQNTTMTPYSAQARLRLLAKDCNAALRILYIERIPSEADEESGRLPLMERKRFKKLLDELAGVDAVVVYNIDRLTRNWPDQAILEEKFSGSCTLLS